MKLETIDNKLLLLKLQGNKVVNMIYEINSEHIPNLRYEKEVKVLYLKSIRIIYRCIKAELQYFKLFTEKLKEQGYILNTYDKCVANKDINCKQYNITCHMDDCFASYME